MSIPGLNPSVPPAQDPPPVPPQIVAPRPASPTLRNRPARQGDAGQEDASSERGLKRGLPAEAEEAGMDIEPSTEPEFKRRRVDAGPATPQRLQALIDAGDEAGLRALLQQAPELLNASHPPPILQGLTPLCYAASKGLEEMARCLIDCGASLEAPSPDGRTPLMYACSSGHLSVAQMLRRHGANLTAADLNGDNCLHWAADQGREAVVIWLLGEGLGVDVPTHNHMTPLMYACGSGHLSVAQMLQQHGANLAAADVDGDNCLQYAATHGREAVVTWLLSEGFWVDIPTHNHMTPLLYACRRGHLSTAQMLQRHGANLTAADLNGDNCLHWAADQGREAVVIWLLGEGLGVDVPTHNHMTALLYACGRGHLSVAQMLWRHGANLTAADLNGDNCLHWAADQGREAVVIWLLGEGLGVDVPTHNHMTALLYACEAGHLKIAQMLAARGAKLNAININGESALHMAVKRGHKTVVTWLLDQNVPVDAGTEMMMTPLSNALENLNWEMMALLIERGASLYRLNTNGERIGDDIFTQAKKDARYDVLLQLISNDWPFPEGWDTLPTRDSSDDSSDGSLDEVDVAAMRTSFAFIHDLDRVFRGMAAPLDTATEDSFIDPAWLLPEKRSDRQQFIESYLNHFLAADEKTSDQPISNFEISSHPLFSYVIHDELTHHPSNFTKLLHALAGAGRALPASYPQKASLFKLQAMQRAWQSNRPFQDAHLSPATLSIIGNVLERQLESLLLAIEAYFFNDLARFPETLKVLCKKYIRLGGDFDAAGFTKALTKQGIYAVNADRLTELVKNAWKDVRLKPLDLPPMATIGQVYGLSESQVMERLFTQINKAVLEDPEEWILPGFATGMATLPQEDQDIYADQILDQWRQMWAALGVALPEVVMSQQQRSKQGIMISTFNTL